jgi:hypothetical protein
VDLDQARTRLRDEAESRDSQVRLRHHDDWSEHLQNYKSRFIQCTIREFTVQCTARFEGTFLIFLLQ